MRNNDEDDLRTHILRVQESAYDLAGRCAVVHAAEFSHLFSEERQLELAKVLGGLLSPEPWVHDLGRT